nr:ATP-binding protein [Myxococcus sp. MH1]
MDTPRGVPLPKLVLPARFEKLHEVAIAEKVPLENIVRKVDTATRRAEDLLRAVRDQGVGRFEFVLGLSGSGKTTFLRTLPVFYAGAPVHELPAAIQLSDVADHLRKHRAGTTESAFYVLFGRDNPQEDNNTVRAFFESLRVLFREAEGGIVLLWPITDEAKAAEYARTAWEVGRDSIVDVATKGTFRFIGLEKQYFYDTADITTQTLNGGRTLETFGITRAEAEPIIREAETIAEFYGRLQVRSREINSLTGDVLKERVVPRVWILLAGDDAKEIYTTVTVLTHGIRNEVDVRRLLGYLDDPNLDAAYLKEWKKRRERMAYLMTLLDVRVFVLPPNVTLGSVRIYGPDALKSALNLKTAALDQVAKALRSTAFYRAILDFTSATTGAPKATDPTTATEYNRLQQSAAKDDKSLNKALGALLDHTLKVDEVVCEIVSEKQSLPDSNLKPDVQVRLDGRGIICLEPTWRTTGEPIPDGRDDVQNTLTPGHIQQYVLKKVLSYVDDLGI